jgi:hypothetical protein
VSQQSTNRSFDDLARAVAEGSISRRRALRLFAGTALAALIPSRALAGDDDDDDCIRICHIPFDDGRCRLRRAETRCLSKEDAERHLKNHRCDCRGSCASTDKCRATTTTTTSSTTSTSTTSTTTTPGPCTAGTAPCCPSCENGANSLCYDNANGMGTTCACFFGDCTDDCSTCPSDFACVRSPVGQCGNLRCVVPCQ